MYLWIKKSLGACFHKLLQDVKKDMSKWGGWSLNLSCHSTQHVRVSKHWTKTCLPDQHSIKLKWFTLPLPPFSWLMHRSVVYKPPLLSFECKPNWHISSSIGIQIPNVVIGHSRDCLLLVFLNLHFLDQIGSLLYSSNMCVENQPKPSIRLLRLLRIQLIFYLFHSSQGWFWWHQIWPGSVFFLAFFQGGPVCCNWSGLTGQFWFWFRRNSARRWLWQNQCFPCL